MSLVLFGALALVLAMWAPNLLKDQIGRDILGVNWISAILIVVFGFFFVTVSSRICGEIGASSNPISGMTVATLLITCLLFYAVGRTGISYKEIALCTAALVCVAAANGAATSQALKSGHLVGATPRKQQIAISWGVVTSAAVIGFTLIGLNSAYTTYHKKEYPGFTATTASIAALAAEGRGDELSLQPSDVEFRGARWDHLFVRAPQTVTAPDGITTTVPIGAYLARDGVIHFGEDPGVCGVETEQLAEDGVTVERKTGKKFDAPKAQLFRLIIDGVLGGSLPWTLVLIGVFVAIMMELCGVPSLAFAVGAYLPISTSAAIFVGGLVRKWSDRRNKLTEAEQESSPGVLCSSGMIAGGALVAILACALVAPRSEIVNGTRIDKTWGDYFNLGLSSHLFSETETLDASLDRLHLGFARPMFGAESLAGPTRAFLETNNEWGFGCFLVLAVFLFVVGSRRRRRNGDLSPGNPTGPPIG
jgi:hypothetical protein